MCAMTPVRNTHHTSSSSTNHRKPQTSATDYDMFPFTPSQLLTVTYVVPAVVPEDTAGTGEGDMGIEDIGTTVVGTEPMYTVGTGVRLSARNA